MKGSAFFFLLMLLFALLLAAAKILKRLETQSKAVKSIGRIVRRRIYTFYRRDG